MRWLVAAALLAACGCSKSAEDASGGAGSAEVRPVMSAVEVKTSTDACEAYVTRACACAQTVAAAKGACDASHALPDAIRVALEVAANPDTSGHDIKQTQTFVRDTMKECIEDTARLAQLGCPP